jgi:1-deoxy-D-xylulose-5-phosphate synthase
LEHPAILHVYTKKGKGFSPAESATGGAKFHSTGPFKMNGDAVEPDSQASGKSFTSVFGEHLVELAEKDSSIVAITSAMSGGTGLGEFRSRFGDRFYDVGIAEGAAVDIAAGLAKSGFKPVVCIYSTFLQRSFDQIFQEVALQNLPVVFCIDRAGVVGSDGATHHGMMDIGFLRMMPNMVLAAPAEEGEMKLALEFALGENRPVCLRYPKDLAGNQEISKPDALVPWYPDALKKPFELGKSVVVRSGTDSAIAIVTYGSVLTEALRAADMLAEQAIAVDVINARFAAPVDEKIIELLNEGKGIITVEDHSCACGFGSAVLEAAAASGKPITSSIVVLGGPKEFINHGSRNAQLMQAGINADKIVETVSAFGGLDVEAKRF